MTHADLNGFLHAAGGRIVTGRGEPVSLRGVGLGNWLLPEGYMWTFPEPGPQSPRQIEALIAELVGGERAAEFWREFRSRFITGEDIARIAAEGMNHVRLPLNARLLITDDGDPIEDGFADIDRLVAWCRESGVWVLLDLHGAPGGQTGTNIDDSLGTPALFEDEHNRALTVRLWRMLARRYRDETAVAGYDLLNEPLPNEYQYTYADRLVSIYRELTAEIRAVDPHHMIVYEGSHWATNWSIFTEVWDENSALQFHKYWSAPDRPSIQRYLDAGEKLGLPIYMGEGGENNLDWFQTAFQLYEDRGIGWNFWPWKKIETTTSPCSVLAPPGWSAILDYAAGVVGRPGADEAWYTLLQLLDNVELARCRYRPEVINAVMRRAPLRIPATGFGFLGAGLSYQCARAEPLRGFREDDAVTIRPAMSRPAAAAAAAAASARPSAEGGEEPAVQEFYGIGGAPRPESETFVVELGPDDWVEYTFDTIEPKRRTVTVGLLGEGAAFDSVPSVEITMDDVPLTPLSASYASVHAETSQIVATGRHTVRITGSAPRTLLRFIYVA